MATVLYQIGDCYNGTLLLVVVDILLVILIVKLFKRWLINKTAKKYLLFIAGVSVFLVAVNHKQYRNIEVCKSRVHRLINSQTMIALGKLQIEFKLDGDIFIINNKKIQQGHIYFNNGGVGCWEDYFEPNSPYIGKQVEISYLRDKYTPKGVDCIVKIVVFDSR